MRNNKHQLVSLLIFLGAMSLLLSNGFMARIFAEEEEIDVFREIQPIGNVLDEINRSYVQEPDVSAVVEGALRGMMNSLDAHSSYIPPRAYEHVIEDTDGEFQGIGIVIMQKNDYILIHQPISGAPAARARAIKRPTLDRRSPPS